ncbi:MAG: response regulator transcription factor [Thermogutta sp.]|nr:response regulator transcription factor [Thermogutta sp.]HOP77313.1 response regulator transcription factor [Thermogutta sp.]HPU06116.1 response regulator transcription factor [Thermogutta sp.]HPZ83763.1 response regulator transcription factor [Thermogutta sp.]HQF13594.1 response regulator transcription factor [Thermogutta sp.]
MAIRVVIADDHEVIRWGLKEMLRGTEIEVIGEASTGVEAVEKVENLRPDVVVLDIRFPDLDGLETLAMMREHGLDTRVVLLSSYDYQSYAARAVALGASEYLLKGASRDEILRAIRAAAASQPPAPDSRLGVVAEAMQSKTTVEDDAVQLTQRETQVLRHIALGLSNREIANSLQISVETVKEHVQNILRKLGVSDRTQAAVWAVRKGLV